MNIEKPWDAIQIELISQDRSFHFFDSDIYILYLLSGYAHVSFEDQMIHLSSDDFVILPKGIVSSLKIEEGNVFLYRIKYSFPIDKLNKYYYVFTGDSVLNGSSKSITVIRILQTLMQSYIFKHERPRSRVLQYYFELIAVLEENFCVKRSFDTQGSIYQKVEALSAYIRNNSENEMRLGSIAEQLFVSEQYLSKMFRKLNQESLSDYIVRCRMEHVISMLQTSDQTITDIAFSAGFTNINSFNRLFKNRFRQTPREYRNQWIKEKTDTLDESGKTIDAIKHLLKEEQLTSKEIRMLLHDHEKREAKQVQFLIGAGDIYRLSEEPMFRQIQLLDSLEFTYVRLTGWLEKPSFDFYKIDMVLEAFLSSAKKPYIEIDISDDLRQPDKLLARTDILLQHILENYREADVQEWMLSIVYGSELNALSKEETDLFYTSYLRIRNQWSKRVPALSIGIGQLRGDLAYEGFLHDYGNLAEAELPDFFAVTMYQVDHNSETDQRILLEGKSSPDPGFMKRKLIELKQAVCDWNTKLVVVDFNVVEMNQLDIMNDSVFKGAYLLKNIADMMSEVEMIGYGALFDHMYRESDRKNELFGAPGLLSLHGLRKSGFIAFQFLLNTCHNEVSIHKDYMLGMDAERKRLRLLMVHYSHLGAHYYYNSMKFHRYNIDKAFEKQKELEYHVDFSHLLQNDKTYKVSVNTYGTDKGSMLEEINQYTRLDIFTAKDVAYLTHRIQPKVNIDYLYTNHMSINVKLKSHEMVFIEIDEIAHHHME